MARSSLRGAERCPQASPSLVEPSDETVDLHHSLLRLRAEKPAKRVPPSARRYCQVVHVCLGC